MVGSHFNTGAVSAACWDSRRPSASASGNGELRRLVSAISISSLSWVIRLIELFLWGKALH
jgi:hypothetical protein